MGHRGTPGLMKRLNRSAILGLLREQGPLCRSDLAKRLELSPSTVTRIVGRLIAEGLVFEAETVDSDTGRKPTLIEFNYKAGAVIGLDVGGTHVVGVLADLQGDIVFRRDLSLTSNDAASDTLERVLQLIEDLCGVESVPREKIRGIGVGVPSIVKEPEGIVVWAPALGWRDLGLRGLLEERFGMPAFVENDVNLAALGENTFGCARGVGNLIVIFIGTGIGSGLVLNGDLYRGEDGAAGEVGYLLPAPGDLRQTYENFGRLESLAGGPGIVRRAKAALRAGEISALAGINPLTARDVFEVARNGDRVAARVVEETAHYLAQAVANLATVLNPEMIVLGGGILRAGDLLLGPIRARVEGTIPVMPEIVLSELGDEAVVQGAVALAIGATRAEVFVQDARSSVADT